MAELRFSDDQLKIVRHRGGSLLVSAAAGSGKTTTMVGHVLDRIRDPEHPGDLSRMLIVTFTRAAAAEMRQRIMDRLSDALEQEPGNAHLQHQLTVAGQAAIGTIDSYCSFLVRNYFHRADIAPDLRLADKAEMDLLQDQLLDQLLEEAYLEGRESFFALLSAYSSEKNHGNIKRMIRDLYQSSQNAAFPEEWLKSCAGEVPDTAEAFLAAAWVKAWFENLQSTVRESLACARSLRSLFEADPDSKEYALAAEDISVMEHILRAEDGEELLRRIQAADFPKNTGIRTENKELFGSFRGTRSGSGYLARFCKPVKEYRGTEEERRLFQLTGEPRQELVRLTLRFSEAFKEACRERNITDFSGMEHLALELLIRAGENGETVRTDLAEDIRRDLDEVIVDEYQDINQIQEYILTALGEDRLFMVGDVKQSIYRFRRARPEIFSEKYAHFSEAEDAPERRIDLKENYRSRREILEGANDLFRAVMSQEVGGTVYDEKAALVPRAKDYEGPGAMPVLLLAETEQNVGDRTVLEARLIAGKIRELMSGDFRVQGKEGKREASYSDIVILMRSPKRYAPVFAEELKKFGIPALYDHKTGFYDTREIQTLLALLKVIDNPRQDIPLGGVLLSPFGGWSEAELAGLRAEEDSEAGSAELWDLLNAAAEKDPKAAEFTARIRDWRELAGHSSLPELIRQLLRDSGYEYWLKAAPDGKSRMANAEELVFLAEQYENSSYRGLFQFLRFIEQQKKLEVEDRGEAQIPDGSENAVRILSIHASKGLEYPVVFVARTDAEFDMRDAQGDYFTDDAWGLALRSVDAETYTKTHNLFYRSAQEKVRRESRSEELRLLYVAVTRAKERLYLVGALKNTEDALAKSRLPVKEKALPLYLAREAKSYQNWLIDAAANGLLPHIRTEVIPEEEIPTPEEAAAEDAVQLLAGQTGSDEAELKQLRAELDYSYPYAEAGALKLAYSVSELKAKAVEAQPKTERNEEDLPEEARGFRQELQTLSGAARGTAYHKLMEYLPFEEAPDTARVQAFLKQAQADGCFSDEEVRSIRPEKVAAFFAQPVGKRCAAAAAGRRLRREQPFVRGLPYTAIDPGSGREDMILLQGIIDLYFEEEGRLVLIDYKTDRVKTESELTERYRSQLEYYAEALSAARDMPVTEIWLYSFELDRFIPLPIAARS